MPPPTTTNVHTFITTPENLKADLEAFLNTITLARVHTIAQSPLVFTTGLGTDSRIRSEVLITVVYEG